MDSEDYLQQLDYASGSISNSVQYNYSTPPSSPNFFSKNGKLIFTDGTNISSNANESEALTLETRTSCGSTPSSNKSSTSSRNSMFFMSPYARGSVAIGSFWTMEMTTLQQAGSYFEAVECLRRVRLLLIDVDKRDRLRFCKKDYDSAVKTLRKQKQIWSDELFKEVVSITIDFFDTNLLRTLPTEVFREILFLLPVNEYGTYFSICSEWYETGISNETWSHLYYRKFLENNPGPLPIRSSSELVIEAFHRRLIDPCIGDKVEVAWRGKFRLETQDVYQGLAWWVAEVVDKHPSHGRYKIRYPGWESRWDEWVPRSRLRWKVSSNVVVSIKVGDVVELWCWGASVPGAWLESKIRKIRGGRYCLGRVISSGYLWVERDRIRLVRRPDPSSMNHLSHNGSGRSTSTRTTFIHSLSSFAESIQSMVIPSERRTYSCVIM